MKLTVRKMEVFTAEQWFKGVKINDVIDNGPFIPSGNYSDRFSDHPDVYVKPRGRINNGVPIAIKEGDWIVTNNLNPDFIAVYSDEDFRRLFEEV